jgi:hypothetical protein
MCALHTCRLHKQDICDHSEKWNCVLLALSTAGNSSQAEAQVHVHFGVFTINMSQKTYSLFLHINLSSLQDLCMQYEFCRIWNTLSHSPLQLRIRIGSSEMWHCIVGWGIADNCAASTWHLRMEAICSSQILGASHTTAQLHKTADMCFVSLHSVNEILEY